METVTVAIADMDAGRRTKLEQSLQGGEGITVLTDIMAPGDNAPTDGEFQDYESGSMEEIVAKIAQLKPRILFMNLDQSIIGDFALLDALHRVCPETLVVLLTDRTAQDEQIIQALAYGARGCLSHEADPCYFLKAVHVIDRGEIWVTRKMLSKIMDKVLH
ncbi:MAG TPA: DNA-binding response regulator [Nitrosospira sp.]|nr:DNA-binding response regulator [Nitrosospira sp.]